MNSTGKIFKDSSNIYQDEARLLFNYYEQAAERIVQQEEKLESEISQLESDRAEVEQKRSDTWKWLLTIIAFFMYFIRNKEYDEQMAQIDEEIAKKLGYKDKSSVTKLIQSFENKKQKNG